MYWGSGGLRVRCVARRGHVVAAPLEGLRWLLLTEVDHRGMAILGRTEPKHLAPPPRSSLPSLTPSELLALGAALAHGAPGTFPQPRPSFGSIRWKSASPLLGCLWVASTTALWWNAERTVDRLHTELIGCQRQLERWQWENRGLYPDWHPGHPIDNLNQPRNIPR